MSSSIKPNGELIPVGGGDTIPLLRPKLVVGRRETCDVCINFPNISSQHCEFTFREGYWYIRDLNSTNGVKVNGLRVLEKILRSEDEVTIGKRVYHIRYDVPAGDVIADREEADVFGQTLLERAGLERGKKPTPVKRRPTDPVENALLDDDD